MRRGEIWTVAGSKDYAGKPRPAVIVQDAGSTPPLDHPNEQNGLRDPCRLMVDRISTVSKTKLGSRIGSLGDRDLVRLNRALLVFLGLGAPFRANREE